MALLFGALVGWFTWTSVIDWLYAGGVWPATLAALLAAFVTTRALRRAFSGPGALRRRGLSLLTVTVVGFLVLGERLGGSELSWVGFDGTQAVQLAQFGNVEPVPQWGVSRSGFEVHATLVGGERRTWRAVADLPSGFTYIGGRTRFYVTQPQWSVFDGRGETMSGGDAVEVAFIGEGAQRRRLATMALDLRRRPEERHWHEVEVSVPSGTRRIAIEAHPGPPGSNDWFDRVWIDSHRAWVISPSLSGLAVAATTGVLVWFAGLAVLTTLRPPYVGWRAARALLVVNVIAVLTTGLLAEQFLRITGQEPYSRTYPGQHRALPPSSSYTRVDPSFGWVVSRQGGDPDVDIHGFRTRLKGEPRPSGKSVRRIMLLGDSFAFGAGLSADQSVGAWLERHLPAGWEVVNLAIPGWGVDQMFLAYRNFESSVLPDVIVLAYIDDDIGRALEAYRRFEGLHKPSFDVVAGELRERTGMSWPARLLNRAGDRSVLVGTALRTWYLRRDAARIFRHVIGSIAEQSRRGGRIFMVVRIPTRDGDRAPVDASAISAEVGADFLDLESAFRTQTGWPTTLYLPEDHPGAGHLTEQGSRFVAELVADSLLRKAQR